VKQPGVTLPCLRGEQPK